MGKFFDLDSPLIRGLNKFADVMWLNILVLIFSQPFKNAKTIVSLLQLDLVHRPQFADS